MRLRSNKRLRPKGGPLLLSPLFLTCQAVHHPPCLPVFLEGLDGLVGVRKHRLDVLGRGLGERVVAGESFLDVVTEVLQLAAMNIKIILV